MTENIKGFNEALEELDVHMVSMDNKERFKLLSEFASEHHKLTKRTHAATELLAILRYMEDGYLNQALCRAIVVQLFIHNN